MVELYLWRCHTSPLPLQHTPFARRFRGKYGPNTIESFCTLIAFADFSVQWGRREKHALILWAYEISEHLWNDKITFTAKTHLDTQHRCDFDSRPSKLLLNDYYFALQFHLDLLQMNTSRCDTNDQHGNMEVSQEIHRRSTPFLYSTLTIYFVGFFTKN